MDKVEFKAPTKRIGHSRDMDNFSSSPGYYLLLEFARLGCESLQGAYTRTNTPLKDKNVEKVCTFVKEIAAIFKDTPPSPIRVRFGNTSFAVFYKKLGKALPELLAKLLPEELHPAIIELKYYVQESFGSELRLDYGTGHETNFFVFLCCLFRLKFIPKESMREVLLYAFEEYLQLCRRIQVIYTLEPAGSHGVWGLDDFQSIAFLFGAAQLERNPDDLDPRHCLDFATDLPSPGGDAKYFRGEYLFIDLVDFVARSKSTRLKECAPVLVDMCRKPTWKAVRVACWEYWIDETLGKFPVMQHLYFGTIIPFDLDGDDPELDDL
ncbi:Phosphotyrosyl phosphatase activator, PTPA like protein [Aduncisulcus paluster]|uniref:Serine/threonine-protein phosphatase 2A activator n=1 Tax=Aduncisulcus paluster TaxID=2918883 RepID=A0ABQ5JXZ8_9EUKA|nr:Phosphotyrosyl phosphatase activator, PTPA like protein [Aduncisulcus paluster]|eukprot:gnl/Carplike_NY0171/3356_a4514_414.p1 GENE.gnl/Carplike_NY0171/3356_a4514_414~~gnl/Carplike_NY0171/3356_a4514_414.p1  ORF type:complete len:332 (+),score=92.18 gnl/Carplike_NY0171/3356_a4514_414:29-997(+)